ncbi:MAG TPA: hypothetical protein PKJ41_09130 [Bryobacteraceae bacterium]|nr:hypothetical protein [Bryobacteraceae bacterium]
MPGAPDDIPSFDFSSLERGPVEYVPVVPGRMEFALEVRRRILARRPEVVAVELPGWLREGYLEAIGRLPRLTALVYPEDGESERAVYVVVEPADPFVEAARTALEIGAEVLFIEPDAVDRPHLQEDYPDSHALRSAGHKAYVDAYRVHPGQRNGEIEEHAAAIAWKLQGADPERRMVAVVSLNLLDALLDAMETPQNRPARRLALAGPDLVNPHPDCLGQITVEMPYLQERYERFRQQPDAEMYLDRRRIQFDLLKEAETDYEAQTGDKLAHWHRRALARYSRNLAHLDQQLVASLYDLTTAARAIVDDNYAWELWRLAGTWPWQQESAELPTLRLSADEIWLNTRRMKLRRRLPRMKRRLMPRGLKPRPKESRPGEWASQIDGTAICSYPPEDLVIEEFGRFVKQKARSMVSEERMRVEPFSTSMLDGVDMRETIRNWHEGKIYVRRQDRFSGQVGAVVIVFDQDHDERYDFLTTWLGEHQNESDMAFYSTQPFAHVVGPGIGRAEYGGLMMTLPARRMFDVWRDADYDFAESHSERLLLAALDYSLERHVVYVASRPPRSIFKSIAAHLGRSVLYVPSGQLPAGKLKRLRAVHVLDGYGRRKIAPDYIW